MGDQPADSLKFGSLSFESAGAVRIAEDDGTILSGSNSAGSLVLSSATTIEDESTADLQVSGNARFAGNSITLGEEAATIGLWQSDVCVRGTGRPIIEDDGTLLTGASSAGSLALTSAGAIAEDNDADLAVDGDARLDAAVVTLGQAANNDVSFGRLTFVSAGHVAIRENDGTLLAGSSSAGSLELRSAGAIADED